MKKEQIRKAIWDLMEKRGIARFPRPVYGRIPNFEGATRAAEKLGELPAWRKARVVKVNPDSPQRPVRRFALAQGKLVYMAVPRLREERCFLELDHNRLKGMEDQASSIKGAFRYGRLVALEEMEKVDLIVAGSVGVNREGARVGKAGGYSDLEYAIGREFGIVGESTTTLTTVHPVQVVPYQIEMLRHDFPLDYIITPEGITETRHRYPKPRGIYWDELGEEKMRTLPLLMKLKQQEGM
jgi:5-formyltetrahydrofolate cyclo-ligase